MRRLRSPKGSWKSARKGWTAAFVLATSAWVSPALGDSPQDSVAFALYEKATGELEAGDFAAAAKDFARADALSPTPAALQAALTAVLKTNDAALGMTLVSRAGREPFHEKIGELADEARGRFAERVGRLVVSCEHCDVTVDGEAVEPGVASWQLLGEHEVVMAIGGREQRHRVTVTRATIASVRPSAPSPPEPAMQEGTPLPLPQESSEGVSPAFFWVGLGLTVAAGVGTVVSFVDLKGIHDDFQAGPNAELADEGDAAQLRTRVLGGVTGGLALATTLVGVLAVDWGGDDTEPVSVVTDGRTVGLRLRW